MCEIVEQTLFYFLDRPMVHSPLSGLPFMVSVLTISGLCICCVKFRLSIEIFEKWFNMGTAGIYFDTVYSVIEVVVISATFFFNLVVLFQ